MTTPTASSTTSTTAPSSPPSSPSSSSSSPAFSPPPVPPSPRTRAAALHTARARGWLCAPRARSVARAAAAAWQAGTLPPVAPLPSPSLSPSPSPSPPPRSHSPSASPSPPHPSEPRLSPDRQSAVSPLHTPSRISTTVPSAVSDDPDDVVTVLAGRFDQVLAPSSTPSSTSPSILLSSSPTIINPSQQPLSPPDQSPQALCESDDSPSALLASLRRPRSQYVTPRSVRLHTRRVHSVRRDARHEQDITMLTKRLGNTRLIDDQAIQAPGHPYNESDSGDDVRDEHDDDFINDGEIIVQSESDPEEILSVSSSSECEREEEHEGEDERYNHNKVREIDNERVLATDGMIQSDVEIVVDDDDAADNIVADSVAVDSNAVDNVIADCDVADCDTADKVATEGDAPDSDDDASGSIQARLRREAELVETGSRLHGAPEWLLVPASSFARCRETVGERLLHFFDREVLSGRLLGSRSTSSSSSSFNDGHSTHGASVTLEWSKRLYKTAGVTYLRRRRACGSRVAQIELSVKVVDEPLRLYNTLAHELCHAAAWILDDVARPPHGAEFKRWAEVFRRWDGALKITTCHNYAIRYKFNYVCVQCGQEYGRHSRSINTEKQVCGCCRGKLRLRC